MVHHRRLIIPIWQWRCLRIQQKNNVLYFQVLIELHIKVLILDILALQMIVRGAWGLCCNATKLTRALSYAVGIYDKLTRRVQLCNIKQIYGMQQTIKGSTINVDENKGENKSFMEKKRDLVELFGSKKSKRIQKSMEENMVNVQSVSGAASITETLRKRINKASEEVKKRDGLASNVESAALVTRNAMLPPHNVDASTPDGVYNVRKCK